ncbi:hypothetical protein SCLCIDRAFT_17102 [Scleroderma citrinum Foug A]|uniref:LsmAD domain-containing protein n=1 Tax=Scleroderma citrinum Foug A TaxID=1036808 RepID=A0A0C3D860_9AGAM|nr:hypothetical protein SCLCIDRAFT_17102 [Scleroderma citrinum Foug A]
MAAPSRPKPQRRAEPATRNNRPQAWTGARPSPTFSPANSPARLPNGPPSSNQGAFPPLAGANGSRPQDGVQQDRIIQSLAGLTNSQRYEGVVSLTSPEGDKPGVTLKDAREISKPGTPLKDTLFIPSSNIDTWQSGPADAKVPNGDSFLIDTEISKGKTGRERELQAWRSSEDAHGSSSAAHNVPEGTGDEITFGAGAGANISWDQFATNEQMFGITTSFNEEVYTTRLDRNAPDFKEKERKAQRIASEIMGATTNNPHMAEERGLTLDDSGVNEEDKYGAVHRGANAYIPPGARKQQQQSAATGAPTTATPAPKAEIPKVSVNGPDGNVMAAQKEPTPPTTKSTSPAPSISSVNKPPADPLPAFRDFVTHERQRLTQKKQALVKSEMDKRKADLVKFSQTFKLNKPIPDDLVPILAKDTGKQQQIREKTSRDASSSCARAIGDAGSLSTSSSASRMPQATAKVAPEVTRKPTTPANVSAKPLAVAAITATPVPSSAKLPATTKPAEPGKTNGKATINMYIQPIPPFKGSKARSPAPQTNGATANAAVVPTSPTTTANRLNANASSFRPNPKANAFTPGPTSPNPSAASASASASPKPKAAEPTSSTPNPFFGNKPLKKSLVNVKDDFNPFKNNKVAEANTITALWPYSGKRYMNMFPPLPHQAPQQPAHMAPPGPPPVVHHVYEEGEQRFGYYYPPGQPMMPGMGPPPPGTYMSVPFMHHMPYPPGMPPNGQPMYAASPIPQIPPQYMQPPPTYAPPPNGAGPRPSMPPTPTPMHAHPYYHQSPQLQHAVPYAMMMPPGGPPPYDSGPAPPMGGVSHA